MTTNRRIVLNIIATYGRSLYALGGGVGIGRWVMAAVGSVSLDCLAGLVD